MFILKIIKLPGDIGDSILLEIQTTANKNVKVQHMFTFEYQSKPSIIFKITLSNATED